MGASTQLDWTYTTDAVGNIRTIVDQLDAANNRSFTYDDAGRLASVERTAAGERVDFAYDGRSFLSRAGEPGAFVFTPVGDLIFADGFESGDFSAWSSCVGGPGCGPPPPEGISPLYDSDGRLYRITDQNGNSQYVFHFGGRPVAQMTPDIQGEIWAFLTTDHLGTPVMASDETGQTLWQGGFEPFGRDYADARGAGIFLRLPGQWWDPVWEDAALGADVYYNVHRWYEYGTGRYTKVDPAAVYSDSFVDATAGRIDLGRVDRENVFRYAFANPIGFVDLLGLACSSCDPCPGGTWSFGGATFEAGLAIGGLSFGGSHTRGTFECSSNPDQKLPVIINCRLTAGIYFGLGADAASSLPFGRLLGPGGCGCKPSDLLEKQEVGVIGAAVVGATTSGCSVGGASGVVTAGLSVGLGFSEAKCTVKRRHPIF